MRHGATQGAQEREVLTRPKCRPLPSAGRSTTDISCTGETTRPRPGRWAGRNDVQANLATSPVSHCTAGQFGAIARRRCALHELLRGVATAPRTLGVVHDRGCGPAGASLADAEHGAMTGRQWRQLVEPEPTISRPWRRRSPSIARSRLSWNLPVGTTTETACSAPVGPTIAVATAQMPRSCSSTSMAI
jgi:hypothetical protein